MIIKLDRGNNTFAIYENVTNLTYSDKDTIYKSMMIDEKPHQYLKDMFMSKSSNDNKIVFGISREALYPEQHDERDGLITQMKEMYYYYGSKRKDEIFRVKIIEFVSNNQFIHIATEHIAYICNDNGKTIEVVR